MTNYDIFHLKEKLTVCQMKFVIVGRIQKLMDLKKLGKGRDGLP